MLSDLRDRLAFAAGVPKAQIARRLALRAQQRIERVVRPPLRAGHLRRVARPPSPIMPPRSGMTRTGSGWRFEALGHTAEFGSAIDWRRIGPPGRDQLWRMTLHYMEWVESLGNAAFQEAVDGWIAANPPYAPVGAGDAWNAYALSLRTTVWMQQAAARAHELPADWLGRMDASLQEQLVYLARHLETDIGGNHLIKNLKALLWAGAYFDGAAARRWSAMAERRLLREIDRQMLPDGMHFELSPSYHCQVFADLLECRAVAGDGRLAERLDRALGPAAQVVADLAHPDGRVAQFADAGLGMAYPPEQCLAAHAEQSGHRVLRRNTVALPDAGYFGLHADGFFAVVDAGRIAPDRLPAHGHGDMLSVELSIAGERMVVDPGVFQYVAGPERAASRSARSHNTLSVPGFDQARFFGAFRSARRARLIRRTVEAGPQQLRVVAAHDGFRCDGGPIHEREVAVSPGRLRIADRLDPPAATAARIAFLLHPAVAAEPSSSGKLLLTGARGRAIMAGSHPFVLEQAEWWPDIGHRLPSTRVIMHLPPGHAAGWVEIQALEPNR